jgi:hypothetical protein
MEDSFCRPFSCSSGKRAESSVKFLAFAKAKAEQFYLRTRQKPSSIFIQPGLKIGLLEIQCLPAGRQEN